MTRAAFALLLQTTSSIRLLVLALIGLTVLAVSTAITARSRP